MAHDLVIRNGVVVDGRGGETFRGDLAIDGDRITRVGGVADRGRRELDADGRLVTPGFIDIHTHLDAQLAWDPLATSSCWHGVTSLVLGNCGVTFAPCRPGDRRYLAELMESVEDVPADSIMAGLDWDWETYGQYLDAVTTWPKGMNVGGMVGHCAVRYHAMGERSLDSEPASDDDIVAMCALVDEAIGAGALGFSTSRTMLHRVPDGRAVPGTYADARELLAIADVLRESGCRRVRGRSGARRAGRHRWSPHTGRGGAPGRDRARDRPAGDVRADSDQALTGPASGGTGCRRVGATPRGSPRAADHRDAGSACSSVSFTAHPSTEQMNGVPCATLALEDRLVALRDRDRRAALVAAARDLPTIPPEELFVLPAGDARYDLDAEDSLAGHASRLGVSPAEAFITIMLESDGRALVNWPFLNDDLDAVATMLRHPDTVMGLADAGAHVGLIMDSSQPTFLLTHWVRDHGLLSVGEAIRRLSSAPALLFGLTGRGVLVPGTLRGCERDRHRRARPPATRVCLRLPRRGWAIRSACPRIWVDRRERRGIHGSRGARRSPRRATLRNQAA